MSTTATREAPVRTTGYRAEIEGLRAVAVGLVIAFHMGLAPISGGFVGVDVFFVISGYLITRNIQSSVSAGTFSYGGFYGKRIRRIVPLAVAVVAFTVALGLLFLTAEALVELLRSAAFAVLGLVNFHFWSQSGYWAPAAETMPLLHYWSLSVEEQFYLFWPFLIAPLVRRFPGREAFVIALLVVAGVVVSWAWTTADSSGAFYMMPPRLAELALGGLLVFLPPPHRRRRLLLSVFGLAMVAAAALGFDGDMPFPGLWVLIPIVGTALFIWAAPGTPVAKVMGNTSLAFIGKRSYALYLFHWPLTVYFITYYGAPPQGMEILALLAAILVASEVGHRIIEQPFRKIPQQRALRVGVPALAACGAVLFAATAYPKPFVATMVALGADPLRDTGTLVRDYDADNCARAEPDGILCRHSRAGDKSILIIGDSHAQHFRPAIATLAETENARVTSWTLGSCPPLFGLRPWYGVVSEDSALICGETIKAWRDFIVKEAPDVVVVAAQWSVYFEEGPHGGHPRQTHYIVTADAEAGDPPHSVALNAENFVKGLRATVAHIERTGAQAVVLGQVPDIGAAPKKCMSPVFRHDLGDAECRVASVTEIHDRSARQDRAIAKALAGTNGVYVDAADALCPPDTCAPRALKAWYEDATHLSTNGALAHADALTEAVRAALHDRDR